MRILRLMGCDSRQYASMERYLVRACEHAVAEGNEFHLAYDAPPASEEFAERIVSAGGHMLVLGSTGPIPAFMTALDGEVRRRGIDVLHAYFTPVCHYAMAYAAMRGMRGRLRTSANNPLTSRLAAGPLGAVGRARFAATQRALARLPRRILVLSEAMRAEFASLGVRGDVLQVVNGGVDERYFVPADAPQRAEARLRFGLGDEVAVVTAARMVPVKRLDLLIGVAERIPSVRVLIAGDGPLRDELEDLAASRGVAERVSFVGQLADARCLLAAADLFVLPTMSEGLSNSVMEAMACGVAVVASDIPANAEIVASGESGILVPPGDLEALAAAVAALAADPVQRARLAGEGRKAIDAHFNVGRRVSEELAVYRSLVS